MFQASTLIGHCELADTSLGFKHYEHFSNVAIVRLGLAVVTFVVAALDVVERSRVQAR